MAQRRKEQAKYWVWFGEYWHPVTRLGLMGDGIKGGDHGKSLLCSVLTLDLKTRTFIVPEALWTMAPSNPLIPMDCLLPLTVQEV